MIDIPNQPIAHATNQPATSQQQMQQAELKDLMDDHVGQFFKELKLRVYVEKILAKNNQ